MPDISPPVRDLQYDTEVTVLSGILTDPTTLGMVSGSLVPAAFTNTEFRRIYQAMLGLSTHGKAVSPITVIDEMGRDTGVYETLSHVYEHHLVSPSTEVPELADRLREWHRTRWMRGWIGELAKGNDTADALTAKLQSGLEEISGLSTLPKARAASESPELEPVTWRIDGFWPAGEVGLMVGDGGSFKSTAAAHLCAAIAGGYLAFGCFATTQASTLYVSAEDPEPIVAMRLRAFCTGQGWDPVAVMRNVHIIADPGIRLDESRWQSHVLQEARRIRAGWIVLDPLADLLGGGDENSNTEMRPIIAFLRRMAKDTGAAIAIVHHAGKAGQDKRLLDRIRGASALNSASRAIYFFDYKETGIQVTNLKQSRGPRLETFMLNRTVQFEHGNPGNWWFARLEKATVQEAAENRGETFVLATIAGRPWQLTSTDLKRIGGDNRVRGVDVSSAISSLQLAGKITFRMPNKKTKLWGLGSGYGTETDLQMILPRTNGQDSQTSVNLDSEGSSNLAHLAHSERARSEKPCPPCPDPSGQDSTQRAHPAETLPLPERKGKARFGSGAWQDPEPDASESYAAFTDDDFEPDDAADFSDLTDGVEP